MYFDDTYVEVDYVDKLKNRYGKNFQAEQSLI